MSVPFLPLCRVVLFLHLLKFIEFSTTFVSLLCYFQRTQQATCNATPNQVREDECQFAATSVNQVEERLASSDDVTSCVLS